MPMMKVTMTLIIRHSTSINMSPILDFIHYKPLRDVVGAVDESPTFIGSYDNNKHPSIVGYEYIIKFNVDTIDDAKIVLDVLKQNIIDTRLLYCNPTFDRISFC